MRGGVRTVALPPTSLPTNSIRRCSCSNRSRCSARTTRPERRPCVACFCAEATIISTSSSRPSGSTSSPCGACIEDEGRSCRLHAVVRRSVFLVWLVAILGILAPSSASAATTANLETRVKAFERVAPTLIGRSAARTPEKHREKSNAYDELASGSPLAAEGAAMRGPASGASVVSPPGAGQVIRGSIATPVFEGHGTTAAGSLTVPPGTYLQIPTSAFLPEAVAQEAAMRGTLGSGGLVIPPGGTAPNLVLHPPTPGMVVRPSSWQVTRPTMLGDMLEPNMGFCVWGACR
ncbi:hypothetical protein BH09PAT4_BH09PAT4_09590 [soil metagenome]